MYPVRPVSSSVGALWRFIVFVDCLDFGGFVRYFFHHGLLWLRTQRFHG